MFFSAELCPYWSWECCVLRPALLGSSRCAAIGASSQHRPQPSRHPPIRSPRTRKQPTETLKVNVNVVQLFFNVKDKHGALIPNLTKDDFDIFEDGKPQTVKYFTAESNLPLTLGILIDSSGSQLRRARHGERSRRSVSEADPDRQR